MIKRPERLKVISKRFTIAYVEAGHEGLEGEDNKGMCDSLNQDIFVEDGMKYDTEKETVLHEITHAISDEMGLGMTEAQVDGFAKGMLAVLMDNPSFAKYLLKKEKQQKG